MSRAKWWAYCAKHQHRLDRIPTFKEFCEKDEA
jgi:hypothetical protein